MKNRLLDYRRNEIAAKVRRHIRDLGVIGQRSTLLQEILVVQLVLEIEDLDGLFDF